jgi:hypothetical protein
MTYAELKRQVLHLGLLDGFDDESLENAFSDAATRAIREVALIFPREGRATLAHHPLRPITAAQSFTHRSGEVSIHSDGVAAFCFYVSGGGGKLSVSSPTATHSFEFNGAARTLVKRTVQELFGTEVADLTLKFTGNYYIVSELCFFDAVTDDLRPPMDGATYDMRQIVPDFGRFSSRPFEDGTPVMEDYYISGSRITLSSAVPDGDYTILYEHYPEAANADDPTSELDVERDTEILVPHLCAYYMWMDDQPEKASQFYQRFTEQAAILRSTCTARTNIKYRSINGWD